jgi:cobalt-zinc-cadmium efflux system protein
VIAAVILGGTWGLLRDAVNLSLDAVPEDIDPRVVEAYLAGQPGVTEVHDLHIWAMSTTETGLTVHLVRDGAAADDALLERMRRELHDRFSIEHATFQIEAGDPAHPCPLAPAHVV